MEGSDFCLRWESTGDQWWYVSPIDYAAANGHYDLVRELLYMDANLLIKLTSLRRIRRLETVWDDEVEDEHRHRRNDVAKSRASVAKSLLLECETEGGHNSLIRAGYGGWLLYTAASAGDLSFVQELLDRDPLLVFGEGEYGITDLLYAAARSQSSQVFKLLMDSAVGMRTGDKGAAEEAEFCDGFRWEMVSRGVHCAARAGCLDVLKELLVGCSDVLAFRDALGSTILHSAAGRGHVKVVEHLVGSFKIIGSTDHQGNTALHIAAYKGFLPVVEALLAASPSLATATNKEGNTFLHAAVSGFQAPGFHRLDQQLELVRQLVSSKMVDIQEIVNSRNNQGRTALHLAVAENIQFEVVELLMTVPCIHLNVKDSVGRTPMDILKRHPQSGSSRLLIKSMVSAGGTVSYRENHLARGAMAAHLKMESGLGTSPGTSFRVPDSEIFLYAADETNNNNNNSECDGRCVEFSSSSGEILSQCNTCSVSGMAPSSSGNTRRAKSSMSSAVARLKVLLQWPNRKSKGSRDQVYQCLEETTTPTPLRERFSNNSSPIARNKKGGFVGWDFPPPSPCGKNKYSGNVKQHPKSPLRSRSPMPSPSPCSTHNYSFGGGSPKMFTHTRSFFASKSRFLCFGAQGMATTQVN